MLYETIKYRGRKIDIYTDENPMNPRTEFDNVGQIVHWHKHYDFGKRISDPEEWLKEHRDSCIILPLSLLDHSGLSMWVGSEHHWSDDDGWDSGHVGWVYCTKDRAIDEWGEEAFTKDVLAKAMKYMAGEIKTYDQYLRGDVYGYEAGEDSCWGFYGHDHEKSGLLEQARAAIDWQINHEEELERKRMRLHCENLKRQIKAKAPLSARQAA